MQERDIKLLFENGTLRACIIMQHPFESGYIASFCRQGTMKPDIILDTRKRKSSDMETYRCFKTLDGAVSVVKNKIGFTSFEFELQN